MGPKKHNIYHQPPDEEDLALLRDVGLRAIPLVRETRTPEGQVYYPVFLPFDARVVCPWCFKVSFIILLYYQYNYLLNLHLNLLKCIQECAISTYPSHTTGPRMCERYPKSASSPATQPSPQPTVPPRPPPQSHATANTRTIPEASQLLPTYRPNVLPFPSSPPPTTHTAISRATNDQFYDAMFERFTAFMTRHQAAQPPTSRAFNRDDETAPGYQNRGYSRRHDTDDEYMDDDNFYEPPPARAPAIRHTRVDATHRISNNNQLEDTYAAPVPRNNRGDSTRRNRPIYDEEMEDDPVARRNRGDTIRQIRGDTARQNPPAAPNRGGTTRQNPPAVSNNQNPPAAPNRGGSTRQNPPAVSNRGETTRQNSPADAEDEPEEESNDRGDYYDVYDSKEKRMRRIYTNEERNHDETVNERYGLPNLTYDVDFHIINHTYDFVDMRNTSHDNETGMAQVDNTRNDNEIGITGMAQVDNEKERATITQKDKNRDSDSDFQFDGTDSDTTPLSKKTPSPKRGRPPKGRKKSPPKAKTTTPTRRSTRTRALSEKAKSKF